MAKKRLTDRFLESIKRPQDGRLTFSDTLRPGLHLRVGTQKASWMYEKRVKGGRPRKHTLGAYCTWTASGQRGPIKMTLGQARALALEIDAESSKGIDRVAEMKAQSIQEERTRATQVLLADVLDAYEQLKLKNLRTGSERARELRKVLHANLGQPITDLSKAKLQAVIDAKVMAGRLVYANRTRAYIRAFTNWATKRDYLDEDVGADLEGTGTEQPRDRVLSLDEVRHIYEATSELGPLWGPMFRLLILTGQRRSEISALKWEEVDLKAATITLEGQRTKNKRAHVTHLSPPALQELQDVNPNGSFVFSVTGVTPSSGISKAKRKLDTLLGDHVAQWRLHDLRRAMATALAHEGVPEGVVDRILNHAATSSAPSSVARVYQQSDLLPQRAAALDLWADMVTAKREPAQNVVPLRGSSQ